jgi:ferric-dicitrate binding protein FerR (iron transport regulator)
MKEKINIGNYIVDYFLEGGDEIKDPVLIAWLDESELNKSVFRQYEKIWNESKFYMDTSAFDPGVAWKKINHINRTKERTGRRLRHLLYSVSGAAASILVVLTLSFAGIFEKKSDMSVSMKAGYGSRSDITLPDGTIVKLNSGSDIAYSYDHQKKIRKVEFQGEGFFDVSKDETPFVIAIKDGPEIRVLGTSFNLQAYPQDQTVQTSLIEGSVELIYEDDKLRMNPGDIVAFNKETNQWEQVDGILSHAYGWLENKLYMDEMSLADVCKYLERWYDMNITVQSGLSEQIHYNGVLQEETIIDAMNSLTRSSEIAYHVKGKNIRITSK